MLFLLAFLDLWVKISRKAGAVLMGHSASCFVRSEEAKPRLTPSPGLITRLQERILPVEWVTRPMEILIICGRY